MTFALSWVAFLFLSGTPGLFVPSAEAEITPALYVELAPYAGVIPAHMANGRPVYQFIARVHDPEKKVGITGSRVLLQAGMTRELPDRRRGSDRRAGVLKGRVHIDRRGVARYSVTWLRNDRVVLSSSAYVRLPEEVR
jgi:hypothetical protein